MPEIQHTTPPEQTTTPDAAATPPDASTTGPDLTEGNAAPEGGQDNVQGTESKPEGGEGLEDKVKKLTDESAQRRIKLRETQKELEAEKAKGNEVIALLRKLTGEDSSEDSTPEQLLEAATKRAAAAEGRIKELEQEQMLRGAIDGVAKPSIIPFLKGSGALNDLSETGSDYAGLVKALISETVAQHPEFGATRIARTSGNAETPTVDTSNNQLTRADLQAMTSEEILKADRDGRLNHLKKKK